MKIFIDHHLGMGDTIVHNGLVRKISEENPDDEVYVLSKFQYFENVKFMYRDNKKIVVISNSDTNFNDLKFDIKISTYLSEFNYDCYFDDAFYMTAKMNPEVKKEYFYLFRDENRENEVFEQLITSQGIVDYTFLHEKKDGGIRIDRNRIETKLPIVCASEEYSIFDLLKVIENAKSVNLISSAFLSLMMCKKYNKNIFAHMYCDNGRKHISSYVEKHNINVLL